MNYLSVEKVSRRYGEKELLKEVTFGVDQGEKAAIIGINGSGKSTLFNIIAGDDSPDTGSVVFNNNISIGYLSQNPQFDLDDTIAQAIFKGDNELLNLVREYEHQIWLSAEGREDQTRMAGLIERIDALQAWDYESRIRQILGKLGIFDLNQPVGVLSGGQKKRIALARVLIEDPDFLILDEPTNHLDLDVIEWLENYLSTQNKTLLMVTHDRYFLESVTNEILELHDGRIYTYKGNYSFFLEKKAEREAQEQQEVEKARNLMRKELDWIRRQPKARGTKAKYRIDAFEDLKTKASRKTEQQEVSLGSIERRQGKKILELNGLKKSFGEKKILDGFSYVFKRSDRIGIIGKNATGKTTFLNILSGKMPPDEGHIDKGVNTLIGYYTQQEIAFDEKKKVIEVATDIAETAKSPDGSTITASQFLNLFKFPPSMQYNYVERLSGGEKRRLQLLTTLIKNPNFLILDEPTNDLDIVTLNILEEYLMDFPGCLMIVTHDRYFMDRLVDHLFVFEGDGKIRDFPGNYTDFRNQAAEEKAKEEKTPVVQQKSDIKRSGSEEKKKLSFKEKREYEQLGEEIERLENLKNELVEKLNSGTGDHEELMTWSNEIEKLDRELESKTDRWLELSEYT